MSFTNTAISMTICTAVFARLMKVGSISTRWNFKR